jgi:hypothetical protein
MLMTELERHLTPPKGAAVAPTDDSELFTLIAKAAKTGENLDTVIASGTYRTTTH